MNIINVNNTLSIVFKPKVKINIVEFEPFMPIQVFFIHAELNINLKTSLESFIESYSPYQVGQVIPVDCDICLGKKQLVKETYHIRAERVDQSKFFIDCKSCNGTGKQDKTIKSIRLEQAKELPLEKENLWFKFDNELIEGSYFLLVGKLQ